MDIPPHPPPREPLPSGPTRLPLCLATLAELGPAPCVPEPFCHSGVSSDVTSPETHPGRPELGVTLLRGLPGFSSQPILVLGLCFFYDLCRSHPVWMSSGQGRGFVCLVTGLSSPLGAPVSDISVAPSWARPSPQLTASMLVLKHHHCPPGPPPVCPTPPRGTAAGVPGTTSDLACSPRDNF